MLLMTMTTRKFYYRKAERHLVTFLRQMIGQEPRDRVELACSKENFGDWMICPVGISRSSTILSLGVGNDVRFDRRMIETYGCEVHAYDPTPRWVDWIKTQELPAQFHFHPYAVGGTDSVMQLYPRVKKGKRSDTMMTMFEEGDGKGTPVEVTVKRISTILSELGVREIDILKMDIEGAEYEVIDDILDSGISVYQLVVEFHHRFRTLSVEKTKAVLLKLRAAGYRIFHITDKCREYSFIHEETLHLHQHEKTGLGLLSLDA